MLKCSLTSVVLVLFFASVTYSDTGSYSDYLYLLDVFWPGWLADSTEFNGPVRFNEAPSILSDTPGRDHDPYFYSLTMASDSFYTVLADTFLWISSDVPHPENTCLWIEPYELMCQGPPWFNLGADVIPFGSDSVDWQTTFNAAENYGLVIDAPQSGSRLIIESDSLHMRETSDGPVQSWCIGDLQEPVVWIDNLPDDIIYLRTMPPDSGSGLTVPMTVGCNGDLFIMGDISYQPSSGGILGVIIRNGDLVIADTPDFEPWQGIWAIATEEDLDCCGSFLVIEGEFKAEWYLNPVPAVSFNINGGLQLHEQGPTAASGPTYIVGFLLEFDFDSRLFTSSPPFYPAYDAGTGIGGSPEEDMNGSDLTVLGNPFGTTLNVHLISPLETPGELRLVDMSGRTVLSSMVTGSMSLQTEDLPAGTYVLVLETASGNIESRKVIKL